MNNNVNRRTNLQRSGGGVETGKCSHGMEPGGNICRRIRMDCADGATVTCSHSGYIIGNFSSSTFAYDYSVRTHTKRLPDEHWQANATLAFCVRVTGGKTHHVWMFNG